MSSWVVSFSGGVSSWAAARLAKDYMMEEGDEMHLLFADTKIEDRDTYRFLEAAAENLGAPLIRVADGRTPWQVFVDVRYLGDQRVDPCSRVLKRDLIDRWVRDQGLDGAVQIFGIEWTEIHRIERLRARGKNAIAPLAEPDDRIPPEFRFMQKADQRAWAKREGLPDQRLYRMGLPHANCGGGCIKAGTAHFRRLLERFPERYAEWEKNEEDTIAALREKGITADLGLLRDRSGGGLRRITLREFRESLGDDAQASIFDPHDWGGCGCAID